MTPIFLIAGSPGVGKATIGRALAGTFPKSIHIPVDVLRYWVVSGLQLPGPEWGDGLVEQLKTARSVVASMAFRYSLAGFAVTVDDFLDPYSWLAEYGDMLTAPRTHKVLLFPSEETALARNLGRYGPGEKNDRYAGAIRFTYPILRTAMDDLEAQGWIIVDSTDQSVEETITEIQGRTMPDR